MYMYVQCTLLYYVYIKLLLYTCIYMVYVQCMLLFYVCKLLGSCQLSYCAIRTFHCLILKAVSRTIAVGQLGHNINGVVSMVCCCAVFPHMYTVFAQNIQVQILVLSVCIHVHVM